MSDRIRTCIFSPYAKDQGPRFRLSMYDTHVTDDAGRTRIHYILSANGYVIFDNDDFYCSLVHAIDSDATVASLMTFLTLRPGDTDASYFDGYDSSQHYFARHHAEALAAEVAARFGTDA